MLSNEGRSFASCSRIFRANLRHFLPKGVWPGFKMGLTRGEGMAMEVEFRNLGGGFQGFKGVRDGLEVSKWLTRLSVLIGRRGSRNWPCSTRKRLEGVS